jgi:hypothetical protein
MAGDPDSAAVHWQRVADSWEFADAELAPRRSRALARLAAVRRGKDQVPGRRAP